MSILGMYLKLTLNEHFMMLNEVSQRSVFIRRSHKKAANLGKYVVSMLSICVILGLTEWLQNRTHSFLKLYYY